MGLNSTPFLSYHNIKTEGIDLLDDAWGFVPQFCDVFSILKVVDPVPGKRLTQLLIEKIRKNY